MGRVSRKCGLSYGWSVMRGSTIPRSDLVNVVEYSACDKTVFI